MLYTEEQILTALAPVQDPDLKKGLVELGMIQNIVCRPSEVHFTVVLTTPACPLKEVIRKNCEEAVRTLVGLDTKIFIEMSSEVTTSRRGPLLPGVKNLIAIGSGKGGVGKSTVTVNLALALVQMGCKVGLIDADIFGPSMPTMLGCETARLGVAKVEGRNIMIPVEPYGLKMMSIGLLAPPDDAVVWRGPMASAALRQFISDTDWGELDYLLVDLPPGTSDIHLTLVQTVPVTGSVIVTTPQKVALADAQKAVGMFTNPKINVPILGVVENMAYFTPEELPENKYYIFGKDGGKALAQRNNLSFLGSLPIIQSIRSSGDEGTPAVLKGGALAEPFLKMAEELARQVAMLNAKKQADMIEEV